MVALLLIAGGSIVGILGLLHALYTFADSHNPRRLAPDDPEVLRSMASSKVRLSSGGTTMWRAWLGFKFSHSLGALLFSAACVTLGLNLTALAPPKSALLLPVIIGTIYLWLAMRYWFRIPAIGIALGTLSFAAAWMAYRPPTGVTSRAPGFNCRRSGAPRAADTESRSRGGGRFRPRPG